MKNYALFTTHVFEVDAKSSGSVLDTDVRLKSVNPKNCLIV